jgi:hypothetical protein
MLHTYFGILHIDYEFVDWTLPIAVQFAQGKYAVFERKYLDPQLAGYLHDHQNQIV